MKAGKKVARPFMVGHIPLPPYQPVYEVRLRDGSIERARLDFSTSTRIEDISWVLLGGSYIPSDHVSGYRIPAEDLRK